MTYVHAWYAIKSDDGTWLFAPSKFIGYTKNTAEAYLSGARSEMDGRDTELVLQEWFRVVPDEYDTELDDALRTFLRRHGDSRPNAKARIGILKDIASDRKRLIDASIDPDLRKRIHFDATICSGRPHIQGTRIWVCDILDMLANGVSMSEILDDYPYLTEADLRAALAFGAEATEHRVIATDYRAFSGERAVVAGSVQATRQKSYPSERVNRPGSASESEIYPAPREPCRKLHTPVRA